MAVREVIRPVIQSTIFPSTVFGPEAGLGAPANTFPPLGFFTVSDVTISANSVVFACEISMPVLGTGRGVLIEMGASGVGFAVAYNGSNNFVFRTGAGSGGIDPPGNTTAAFNLSGGSIPVGTGTLVAAVDRVGGNLRIRGWWNGGLLSSATAVNSGGTNWAGTNPGAYGTINTSVVNNIDTTSFNGTLISDLRYYEDVTIPG